MGELSASKKKKLQEVADGMLAIYRTLERMQYINPDCIAEGPHDISSLLPLYKSLEIDPAIIYLYSILPYVNEQESGLETFFQGGRFADFRDKGTIELGRNPMYDYLEDEDETKGGMRPWMTPLNLLGNHQSVIIYDAKDHCIGIINQEYCGSSDRNINVGFRPVVDGEDGEDDEESGVEGEKETGESEDEYDEDDVDQEEEGSEDEDDGSDSEEEEEQVYDNMASRPAIDVLRDIVTWYEDFSEVPGNRGLDPEEAGRLYRKNGWPSPDFDKDGLLVDQARALAAEWAKDVSEEVIREVSKYKGWLKDEDGLFMRQLREKIDAAKTEDELWLAKWELWKAEDLNRWNLRKMQEAEKARDIAFPRGKYCRPDELVLGEVKRLQEEVWAAQRKLKELRDDAKGNNEPKNLARVARNIERKEKDLAICERAFEAARKDAGSIYPGTGSLFGRGMKETGLDLDSRIADLTSNVKDSQEKIGAIRKWLASVPVSAILARQAASNAIQDLERHIQVCTSQLNGCKSALEKLEGITTGKSL